MRVLPTDFAALLSRRGRRILEGRDKTISGILEPPTSRFVAIEGALDSTLAHACRTLLDRALLPALTRMEEAIPPEALLGMEENYAELLPKTVRVRTAMLQQRRSRSWKIAEEVGLVELLRSESYRRFAEVVTGQSLQKKWGLQALCYGVGDYAGPHNDHHPEDEDARDGYVDMHVTLASPAVAHQWLVYAKGGHFSEVARVHTLGGITVYRLPFWHYTTPLVAKPGRDADARRWVLLGTFLYA